MRRPGGRLLRLAAAAAVLLAAAALPPRAAAQGRVIPPGREAVILQAVQEAFVEAPAAAVTVDRAIIRVDTGQGPSLLALHLGEVSVSLECEGGCDPDTVHRWAPVVERLRDGLTRRADRIWVQLEPGVGVRVPPSATPWSLRARQAFSWALLSFALAAAFLAPGRRPPGSRISAAAALVLVIGFLVAALALSPRPLHDHLCFVERAFCAASLRCDTSHHAWGRPTFHVMGLLLALVPHRMPWILGLGVGLTALAVALLYDVTARIARLAGLETRAGQAGLWAAGFAAVHPGFLRLAGTGSFWPLTLVLLLGSFHLLLRAGEGDGRSRTVLLVGAGCAFALALGGNRIVLCLVPLLLLSPYAWPPGRVHPVHALAALPALAVGVIAAIDVLSGDHYGATEDGRAEALVLGLVRAPTGSALAWAFTTPLALPIAAISVLSRRRARATLPVAYATCALAAVTVSFTGPLEWRLYPDGYLKHFPQLALMAPLFGLGCAAGLDLLAPRVGRGAALLAPAAALALVLTAWTRPDATRLLFARRVMEREVAALEEAFAALPPHDALVVAHIIEAPEGFKPAGDALEMHFPVGVYRSALRARGVEPAPLVALDEILAGRFTVRPGTLVYVGSTLRTFYSMEIEAGRVPETLERPELARLRERFALDPAYVFTVPTDQPRALRDRVVADRTPEVDLGFYWLVPREAPSR